MADLEGSNVTDFFQAGARHGVSWPDRFLFGVPSYSTIDRDEIKLIAGQVFKAIHPDVDIERLTEGLALGLTQDSSFLITEQRLENAINHATPRRPEEFLPSEIVDSKEK